MFLSSTPDKAVSRLTQITMYIHILEAWRSIHNKYSVSLDVCSKIRSRIHLINWISSLCDFRKTDDRLLKAVLFLLPFGLCICEYFVILWILQPVVKFI